MGICLLWLTNLAFPFVALGVFFSFLFSGRRRLLTHLQAELRERLGLEKQGALPQNAIWLHCASVGEVNSIKGLISVLKTFYQKEIVITTSTQAGKEIALKNPEVSAAILVPLDFYPSCKRFIKILKPHRLFVVEREIWPNLLWAAHRNNVPYAIINGRISEKSTRAYCWIRPLFHMIFAPLTFAALQNKEAAARYEKLGVSHDKIHICGNVKYDSLSQTPTKLDQAHQLLNQLGWEGKPIFVLGSTHPLEETLLLRAAPDILKTGAKIIFAPRHLERKPEVEQSLHQSGLHYAFASQASFDKNTDVLCVDVMGLLNSLYACAALTFVGGSIAPRGAHNLLEPAILGKTVLFGKHFYNTPDTAHALLEHGGGVLVSETNFKETVIRLLNDPEQLENMSQKAREIALNFKGATDKIRGVVEQYEHRKTT